MSLPQHCQPAQLTQSRRFFPPIEPEAESDWEEVKAGESAENGPGNTQGEENTIKVTLPDVPSGEPAEEGPASKKQKPNDDNI